MKRVTNLYFVFFLGLFYARCSSVESKQDEIKNYYDLTVILDSTFAYNLHERTLLSGPGGTSILFCEYDSVDHSTIYRVDSLIEGKYEFIFKTIFDKNDSFVFLLRSDSLIHLSCRLNLNQRENYSKPELNDADTICIVFVSKGCFHYSVERTTCVKDRISKSYILKTESKDCMTDDFPSAMNSEAPETIVDDIYAIQSIPHWFTEEALSDGTTKLNIIRGFSTTTNNFYINIKNEYSVTYYLENEYDSLIKEKYIK